MHDFQIPRNFDRTIFAELAGMVQLGGTMDVSQICSTRRD